tara:strand:- start:32 stop:232 length:201 start_codon:yes stop_codon:yes gene_type:complete
MTKLEDFIPVCVPENAAEIRAMYKRQRERIAELEAEVDEWARATAEAEAEARARAEDEAWFRENQS